ncbi:MAG: ABC transporter permease subunit [Defluviitaleaceae bacterium]|nr:ABC transporter permease subunit [Defluviitaleaceae bacterium]
MTGKKGKWKNVDFWLYVMVLPAFILVLIYNYIPLFGWAIAFQRYNPALGMFGSPFVGLDNFRMLFANPMFVQVIYNTVYIATAKIILMFFTPLIIAILLNEILRDWYKRTLQTAIYLPHFISWVILGGMFINILHPGDGIVNQILGWFNIGPIFFLGDASVFPHVIIWTDVWRSFGMGTIIYMAAISSIDPGLYEAASLDGAKRFRRMWHITIPGLVPIMVLQAILALGNVLNAGFDQILNMYSAAVYSTGDILDTFIFRRGLVGGQFAMATAAGIFRSGVSLVLISTSYFFAYKFAKYRIF